MNLKIGDRIEVVTGPSWIGLKGTISRWHWILDDYGKIIHSVNGAEITMEESCRGKFTGPEIIVVCARLKNIAKC